MLLFRRKASTWKFKESPFKVLKVTQQSSPKQLKSQFYKLSMEYHPDKNLGLSEAERVIKTNEYLKIQSAYEILKDPTSRHLYLNRQRTGNTNSTHQTYSSTNIKYNSRGFSYDYSKPPEAGKFKRELEIWVFAIGFIGIVYLILSRNSVNQQQRELDIAWDLHRQRQRRRGLEE